MRVDEIAEKMVAEITAAVHHRFSARQGVLVPPELKGRFAVPSMKQGELAMDRADQILESQLEDWPEALDPEVYMGLLADGKEWMIEWLVVGVGAGAGSDAVEEGDD